MKKKGFTLIELLAVIVILAIIALIAVPVVMNIIEKANKSAFKDSAYGILKAGELYYTEQQMSLNGIQEDKVFTFPNDIKDLEINGAKPTGGSMIINKKGQISIAITNGRYCVTKGFEDDSVIINDYVANCKLVLPKTLTYLALDYDFDKDGIKEVIKHECINKKIQGVCSPGEVFAIQVNDTDIYKFYVIEDKGSEVILIADKSLDNTTPWINKNDYSLANSEEGDNTICDVGACNDEGPMTALNALKESTSEWTNIPEREYVISDDGGGDKYKSFPIMMRTRMMTYGEAIMRCKDGCPDYLYDTTVDLWLSAAFSSHTTKAFVINKKGVLVTTNIYATSICSLRPVITLSKKYVTLICYIFFCRHKYILNK